MSIVIINYRINMNNALLRNFLTTIFTIIFPTSFNIFPRRQDFHPKIWKFYILMLSNPWINPSLVFRKGFLFSFEYHVNKTYMNHAPVRKL